MRMKIKRTFIFVPYFWTQTTGRDEVMFHDQNHSASPSSRNRRGTLRSPGRVGVGVMHYQPIVELSSWRRIGAEAIERNSHGADLRLEYAREDIILRLACFEAVTWGHGIVAVNVSAMQLRGGRMLEQIGAALEHSGLAPERLELELSETILTETDLDTLLTLSIVRDLGVGLVLDDFGTGLASLRMLKRLPLTGLKLDVSLLREIPDNAEDTVIACAVIAAAHALGLVVSAAGIEQESQRLALAGFGCDAGQGPLFTDTPRPNAGLRALPRGVDRTSERRTSYHR